MGGRESANKTEKQQFRGRSKKPGEISILDTSKEEFWMTPSVEIIRKVKLGNEWRVSTGFCSQGYYDLSGGVGVEGKFHWLIKWV